MTPFIGNGAIMGLSLVALSFFVLAVTAFRPDARESDTWKALATAIVMTGLLGFTAFVQNSIQRQQEHDLQSAIDGEHIEPIVSEPSEP